MSLHGPATEEAGADASPGVPAEQRFGPNSSEVAAFVEAVAGLNAAQWRKVVAARRLAAAVIRDPSALPVDAVRSLLHGATNGQATAPQPVAALAAALHGALDGREDEEVLAAWQAASALTRRRQMAALTFAAHYVPFAGVIPLSSVEPPPAAVERFAKALRWLGAAQWQALAKAWTLDRDASAALLQAAVRCATREGEESAALAALAVAPKHVSGDGAWGAIKTAVHGTRVLACRAELNTDQMAALWAPLEEVIPLRSLDEQPASDKPARARRARAEKAVSPKKAAAKRGPLYGPNTADVTAFVKAVPTLAPIQWLRVLDRRQLVAKIVRERSAEPAPVVRASVAAIRASRELDHEARCAILSAVERAGYALESREQLSEDQARQHYGAVAEVIPLAEVDASSFPARVAALNREEMTRLAAVAPTADATTASATLSAGDGMADFLAERSDDEIAVTWNAMTALIGRHLLSPIKFAASFAPFATVVEVVKSRTMSPLVRRYVDAAGRLSAHQCALLSEPWLLADDISNVLSGAVAGGSARAAEEAAALTALVTVPMRLTGDQGWAAAKTVAYGARVVACRDRLTDEQFAELWRPIERAIPLASLEARPRSKA